METTDYTFLSPASLPKAKKRKVVTRFVLATIVAVALMIIVKKTDVYHCFTFV